MRQIRNLVGNAHLDPRGAAQELVDPTTGEVFAEAHDSTAEDVGLASDDAAVAFASWSNTNPS